MQGIPKETLHCPGRFRGSRLCLERPPDAESSLQQLFGHGRLAGTGYSILPVDQGIEHSAGASLPRTRPYSTPNIVKLAVEGGCNAVASTLGVLGACARKRAQDSVSPQVQP
jgi:class I fructose-bisphosphate aldolase